MKLVHNASLRACEDQARRSTETSASRDMAPVEKNGESR